MYAVFQGRTFEDEGQRYPVKNGELYSIDTYPAGYNKHLTEDMVFIKDEEHGCIATIPYRAEEWDCVPTIHEYEIMMYVYALCDTGEEYPDSGDFEGSVKYSNEDKPGFFEGTYTVNVIASNDKEAFARAKEMYEKADTGVLTDFAYTGGEIITIKDVTMKKYNESNKDIRSSIKQENIEK